MREQVQRLDKRPSVATQQGQLTTGVTGSVSMPFVQQQKTSGQRLAETLGMLVNTGTKVATKSMELYEGQKKEEAANRIAKEQYQWMDEMNSFGSDAERVQYIRSKVQEVSNDGVDANYREGVLGFFDNFYNTYSKGAKQEEYKAVGSLLSNELFTNMLNGSANYDDTVRRYSHLPKDRYHNAYASALETTITTKLQSVKTQDDFDVAKKQIDSLISEYNNNVFAGGSKSVAAQDLKNKVMGTYDKLQTSFNKAFKEDFNLKKAEFENTFSTTVKGYNKFIDEGIAKGFTTKAEGYKAKVKFEEDFLHNSKVKNQTDSFDIYKDNNKEWENDIFVKEAKEANTQSVVNTFDYYYRNGNINKAIELTMGNRKPLIPVIKSLLDPTGDPARDSEAISFYSSVKGSKDGNFIVNQIDPTKKALLDIALISQRVGKGINYSELYDVVNSKENPKLSLAEQKTFNESFKDLPQGMQDGLYQYGMALLKSGKTLSDTTTMIKDVVSTNVIKLGNWDPSKENVNLINFDAANIKVDKQFVPMIEDFAQANGFDINDSNITYDEKRKEYIFYKNGDMLIPDKIIEADKLNTFKEKWEQLDLDEKLGENYEEIQTAIREKEALKNSFKYPYYDTEGGVGVTKFSGDFTDIKFDREAFDKTNVGKVINSIAESLGLRADELTPEQVAQFDKEAAKVQKELGVTDEDIINGFNAFLSNFENSKDNTLVTDNIDNELTTVLKSEGGFQADQNDSGNYVNGKLIGTNKGITAKALAEYRKVSPSSITQNDIKNITEQEARDIYKSNYYIKPKINKLPSNLQPTVLDMYINSGSNAIKILQRLVNVKADGILGPNTLSAIEQSNITTEDYKQARIKYYKEIATKKPKNKKFLQGWINRANKY